MADLAPGETIEGINQELQDLLSKYYASNNTDKEIAGRIWHIIFRASISALTKKYKWMHWDQLEEWAIENTIQLMRRIDNRDKYPEGYKITTTIATTCFYSILNVAKKYQVLEERQKLEQDWDEYVNYKRALEGEEDEQSES